jgi:hypothetical protein
MVLAQVRRIGAIAAAIAAALALAVYSYASTRNPPEMVGVIAAPGSASIEATDQVGPADQVAVWRVVAPGESWVVAYIAGPNGTPGDRVGAARVGIGESRDVIVPLTGHVAMSQKLVVVLHADRGVHGLLEFDGARFESSPDKPYYVDGSEVLASLGKDTKVAGLEGSGLTAEAPGVDASPGSAVLEVAGRIAVIDRLVVDRVVAPAGSWVAVYLVGDDGVPTERVGLVHVAAGETLGVVVPIDPRQSLTEKVLVALQADLGASSVFEFDAAQPGEGVDRPYVADGTEVSTAVLVRPYGMSADNMPGGGMGGGMSGTP